MRGVPMQGRGHAVLGTETPVRLDEWFLTRSERGNPATTIDTATPNGLAWTEGNAVDVLVHGRTYFSRLGQELRSLERGDAVWVLDWRGDADERLGDADATIGSALADAVRRGVDVRGLVWRSHPDQEKFSEQENAHLAQVVNEAGGEVLLDERVAPFGSHHQKLVLIRRAEADRSLAFVGGVDLGHGRADDERHLGDPQAIGLDDRYGPTPAWHDVQLRVRGPAVGDLARTFRERWEDTAPLDHPNPIREAFRHYVVREPHHPHPLPSRARPPQPAGDVAVQVLRTYPRKRPAYPFAPDGERSIARAYIKAMRRARSLVYVEDQYLWSNEVASVLAAALHRAPKLRLIAVVPRVPDRDGPMSGPMQRIGQIEAVGLVRRAGGDRVGVYDLENEQGRPIYVHAKVCIVDDVWMSVGSDNLNLRSWTHDSELTCALLDDVIDGREPADPGGRGDAARVLPRDLRLRLWREHLGRDLDEADLLDPVRAFETWRRIAGELDAWHAAGRPGPRPAGRVRRHDPEAIPAWSRPWAAPLHRLVVDQDGRPRRMRGRHVF
jgi:phosphatidylserine/phosphatidylglycerophosphate/cardiolipin synthase-like enzyme